MVKLVILDKYLEIILAFRLNYIPQADIRERRVVFSRNIQQLTLDWFASAFAPPLCCDLLRRDADTRSHKRRNDKVHVPACLVCRYRQWRTQRLACIPAIYNVWFIMFISAKIATFLLIQRDRSRARSVTSPLAVADVGSDTPPPPELCNCLGSPVYSEDRNYLLLR